MFDRHGINKRFLSFFADKSQADLMALFDVGQSAVSSWHTDRKQVPWEKLRYLVKKEHVTWDWLLDGKKPKYRSG
jgi:transcriptional regulator with XRE-family HTH domain